MVYPWAGEYRAVLERAQIVNWEHVIFSTFLDWLWLVISFNFEFYHSLIPYRPINIHTTSHNAFYLLFGIPKAK